MATNRVWAFDSDLADDQFGAILDRALRAYHRDELHGEADWIGERLLDAELTPVTREAFLDADELPCDHDVLQALDTERMALLGEGFHVMTLVEPARRFVVKYAKSRRPLPPLAPLPEHADPTEWTHDYGVRPGGSLHPAIWQHIRSFEAYGHLVVPSRTYIADRALERLDPDERRRLERFRSSGIVRSLGSEARLLRIDYGDTFPSAKRASDGVAVSVLVTQPIVTPLTVAIERLLREGDVRAARHLEAAYEAFTEQVWRNGVSHLDLSMLNIGLVGSGGAERLAIFDPHLGVIERAEGAPEVRDPLSEQPQGERSLDSVLRSSRDGSRWALWRVQEKFESSEDVPPDRTEDTAVVVREFHEASEGLEEGHGLFGLERFGRMWQQRPTQSLNPVLHAQLWVLLRHPLGGLVRSVLDHTASDSTYDRSVAVLAMDDDRRLAQFRAGLKVYENRPLFVVVNVADTGPTLMKHWGRLQLPPEVDVQDDPAIHYHLRDLFTGEVYVRSGDDLVRRGFVVGLAPDEVHMIQVEDVVVEDLLLERALAAHRDLRSFLKDCTRHVGVVGDVHGELDALQEILRALGFIDSAGHWFARDGTLVFTGDIGHGRHLQQVFDFIHGLAAQAHRLGGRIVWTLGNHDLYVDREGGQGGEESLGYRLWPTIREAALHPERHPGLHVQAAYSEHGKLFVHGGILPNIVELAMREGRGDSSAAVAAYVNDALRHALVERERIAARDLPHEIFHIGTSHTRERRMPGEIGYEPAGVFTPDLRELDHYRYHDTLLPQVVGHTASRNGEIRYAPGSWLCREYIAIDVGRQHGRGNGGLLLTDFGWVAVTPAGPAPLVEVSPLFVKLAHDTAAPVSAEADGAGMLSTYFHETQPERRTLGDVEETLFTELAPAQVVALERFLDSIRETGRCAIVTDLDQILTAFSGGDLEHDTIALLADYLAAGGTIVFSTDASFAWFYTRLLRPLVVKLGPRSRLLENTLLILSGGAETFVFQDGAYRLLPACNGPDRAAAFDALVALSHEGSIPEMPRLDPPSAAYMGNSFVNGGIDHAMAARVGTTMNLGDAMLDGPDSIINLHRGYLHTIEVIAAATAALHESGRTTLPRPLPAIDDTLLWTFKQRRFPVGCRVRVRVAGGGFVHAGVAHADGTWNPVYKVPLVPVPNGEYEAVLPEGVNAFTFFWTEAPWTPGLPGHWERERSGGRVFEAAGVDSG